MREDSTMSELNTLHREKNDDIFPIVNRTSDSLKGGFMSYDRKYKQRLPTQHNDIRNREKNDDIFPTVNRTSHSLKGGFEFETNRLTGS